MDQSCKGDNTNERRSKSAVNGRMVRECKRNGVFPGFDEDRASCIDSAFWPLRWFANRFLHERREDDQVLSENRE